MSERISADLAFNPEARQLAQGQQEWDDYLDSRPESADAVVESNHYEATLTDTQDGYEDMSMSQLAKEMAEAELAGDQTKFADLDEVISRKVEDFVNTKSERDAENLPENDRDAAIENVHDRLRKIREAEKTRLTGSGDEQENAEVATDQPQKTPSEHETVSPRKEIDQKLQSAAERARNAREAGNEDEAIEAEAEANAYFEQLADASEWEGETRDQYRNSLYRYMGGEALPENTPGFDQDKEKPTEADSTTEHENDDIEQGRDKPETPEAQDKKNWRQRAAKQLRTRWMAIRNGNVRDVFGSVSGKEKQEKPELTPAQRRVRWALGAAAAVGAVYVGMKLGSGDIDLNPFDNDGFGLSSIDLNPVNGDHGQVPQWALGNESGYHTLHDAPYNLDVDQVKGWFDHGDRNAQYVEWATRMQAENPGITPEQLEEMIKNAKS